jgi:hypothetical protein
VQTAGRVPRLDVDEQLVDDHRRNPVVGVAEDPRQPSQHAHLDAQLEIVDRLLKAVEVAALVVERGLLELDVALLQRRVQDHLSADADGSRLRSRDERRHVDHEIGLGLRAAG